MTASISRIEFRHASRSSRAPGGRRRVRALLRLEGFAAFATAVALYAHSGLSWPAFALFFLAPDLAMLAYLSDRGPERSATISRTPTLSPLCWRLRDFSPACRSRRPAG